MASLPNLVYNPVSMPVVVDIETVGLEEAQIPPRALEILFRGIRHPEASEEEIEQRRREAVERFGLDPTTGRIVCIGLLDAESTFKEVYYGEDEKMLLTSFWEYLERTQPELFISFNGKSFDFPYIIIRSAILKVAPSMLLPMRPYTTSPHFDVRELLAGNDRHRKGTLDYFCAIFGISSPKSELDGGQISDAFRDGRHEAIGRYCLADCRATAELYERVRAYYPAT